MHALPPAPAPAPRRQVFVGTAFACAAGAALMSGMLALWMRLREEAVKQPEGTWLPEKITVPEVATNVMLISLLPICIFAQWAVYAAKRQDRAHTGLALGLVGILGLALINAQAYVWATMDLPASQGAYASMFYSVTGVITAMTIIGIVFSGVVAFRFLGGRSTEHELVVSHALYWYTLSALFAAVWFVVYVTK